MNDKTIEEFLDARTKLNNDYTNVSDETIVMLMIAEKLDRLNDRLIVQNEIMKRK